MRSVTITTVLWLLSLLLVVAVASHNDPDVSLDHSATTRNSSSRRYLLLRRNQRRRRSKEDDKKSEKNAPTPTVAPTVEQRKSDTTKATKEKSENTESPVAAPKESSFSDAVFEVATDSENENDDDATDDGTDVVVSSEQEQEEVTKGNNNNNNNKEAKATPSPTIPELPRQANPVAPLISLPPFFAGVPFPPAAPVPVVVAPAPVPVVVPTPVVEPVPVVVPTTLPVVVPTALPVVVPTTMAPVSETTPTPQIVNVTTSPPTMVDSESPSAVPSAMPIVTTDTPVTEPPSDTPSQAPTVASSEMPSVVSSTVPSLTPTLASTVVNITLQGVFEIQYPNVSSTELSTNETGLLETITEEWFQNYYNNVTAGMELELMLVDVAKSTVRKFRNMQVTENTTTTSTNTTNTNTTTRTIQVLIENMVTNITINSQMITPSSVLSNPTYKNVVQYQQQLQYRYFLVNDDKNSIAADGRAGTDDDHDHDNSTSSDKSMDNLMAQVLAVQPFLPVESSKEYQMLVSTNIVPFVSVGDIGPPVFTADDVVPTAAPVLVAVPVPVPVTVPTPAATAPTVPEDKSLSSAAIAGISVGGLVFFGLLMYGFVILPYDYKRATTANATPVADMDQNDMGDGDAAMVAANTTPVKDNSTSRKLAQEQETAAMMNKSIITKQQSYGAEETSTLGGFSANQDDIPDDGASYEGKSIDTTEFDYAKVAGAGVIGGAATAAALSAAGDSDIPGDDNQFVIYAPAGKLGLVVDNPDDGAPVVHAIKEDSVLIGQVHVGDRLIGVDEVDVRTLSPVKVSKLISKRSSNPLRKLTLVRGKPDYDEYDTGTDGGDTASHTVDTASHFPEEEVAASSENLGIPPNPSPMNDDETSHVESMSRLSGDEDNDDDDEEEKEEDEEEEEVEEEEESVMDYPDDTSSVVDAMSHTSGLSGIPPVTVDETKTDDGNAVATTQVGEATSEQATSQ